MPRSIALRLSLVLGAVVALGVRPAFGTEASPTFHQPNVVAVDPQGNVYVAESGPARIVKLTSTGAVITTWGGNIPHTPHFSAGGISSMAADSKGDLWIEERTVRKLSPNGKTLMRLTFAPTQKPWGLATGPRDNLYFIFQPLQATGKPYRAEQRSPSGKVLHRWTVRGPTKNPELAGFAVDPHGNVHVSFTGNDCSRSCEVTTFVIDTFSSTGRKGTTLKLTPNLWEYGLAADATGAVYWARPGYRDNIIKLLARGAIVARWGTQGCGPLQFRNPGHGITVDRAGNLYVPDIDNNTVQKVSPDGRSLALWGTCSTIPTPIPPTVTPTPAH